MTEKELKNKIRRGETSRVQFKQQFTTQKEIAAEMVAFANCEGGELLFGVKDLASTTMPSNRQAASWAILPMNRYAQPSTSRQTLWT